jgi:hypothetical protein
VTVDLVVAAAQMLFFSGCKPLHKTGLLAATPAPDFQFAPVLEKVSVYSRKFARKVALLAFADGAQFDVLAEVALNQRADDGGFGRGP